jgi:hypothetical protein
LQNNAYAIAPCWQISCSGILTKNREVTTIARSVTLQDFYGAGFHGAIRTQQGKDFAPLNLKVNSFHCINYGFTGAIGLHQSAHLDCVTHALYLAVEP